MNSRLLGSQERSRRWRSYNHSSLMTSDGDRRFQTCETRDATVERNLPTSGNQLWELTGVSSVSLRTAIWDLFRRIVSQLPDS